MCNILDDIRWCVLYFCADPLEDYSHQQSHTNNVLGWMNCVSRESPQMIREEVVAMQGFETSSYRERMKWKCEVWGVVVGNVVGTSLGL